jgi:hypothetical protein
VLIFQRSVVSNVAGRVRVETEGTGENPVTTTEEATAATTRKKTKKLLEIMAVDSGGEMMLPRPIYLVVRRK